MKKLLFLACMLWASVASAQLFSPNQILTASQLNNAFAAVPTLTGSFTFTGAVNARRKADWIIRRCSPPTQFVNQLDASRPLARANR